MFQLETRQLLSADIVLGVSVGLETTYRDPQSGVEYELHASPVPAELGGGAAANFGASNGSGILSPLSSVPALNSLPSANASLYLDFDGDFQSSWGAYGQISTPAFDIDGDATTFNGSELDAIRNIWSYVAEDYSPFNINVTTVAPQSFENGFSVRIVIGGNGSWMGQVYGGVAYVDSFTNSMPNVGYVFPKNLGNGNARYTADAASHEAGHTFGLSHQSAYSGAVLTQAYSTGPGNGVAPLMGNSYSADLSRWWNGPTHESAAAYQDDMSIIARPANGFGYRPESAGNTADTATVIVNSGDQVYTSGVILTGQDVNFYTVLVGAGAASFTIQAAAGFNNLVPTIQLFDASGTIMLAMSSASSNGTSATIEYNFDQSGGYRLVARGDGSYGNVGQYSLSGAIVPPPASIYVSTPTNVTAKAVIPLVVTPVIVTEPPASASGLVVTDRTNNSVSLSWNDNARTEDGYQIQRSTNGGKSWSTVAVVGADTKSYTDRSVKGGKRFVYRVVGFNPHGNASPSNSASVTTPRSAVRTARQFRSTGRLARYAMPSIKNEATLKAAVPASGQPVRLVPVEMPIGSLTLQDARATGFLVNWNPVIS